MFFTRCLRGAVLAALLATPFAPAWSDEASPARVTILYDAFGKDASVRKDWGFAALVEVGGKRILFDTGNDAATFVANAKAKGVDFATLDFVVQSHRHADHLAGLAEVLKVNPKVKIYGPKEGFGVYGSSLPSSFYRKNEALPPEQRYYDGKPPETLKFGTAWRDADIEVIDKTTEIAPGVWLIALVSDQPGTLELKEVSLAIDTPEGIVLVVGCSHPGIEKIVEAAAAINPKIHYILGGFHLVNAKDEGIAKIAASLRDTWKVQNVAPGHCTGEATFAGLQEAFGDQYVYAGAGTVLDVGKQRRADLGKRSLVHKASVTPETAGELRGAAAALTGSDLAYYQARARTSPDAVEPKMMKWLRASFRIPEPTPQP
ncbi:MBL fold metallo-hydrolase [Hyphomicrobium sp.]|uniref:MBL fold metallo-hydrolase n=1 Tax=Hyphomicrobium sp. TaxID=82 RepID=UPI0025BA3698|nr:MBL fold metallo-hydrolase [Hyphomicrobium sp.]MCC7251550.1 MBL fold metallo-hydrolase [Hyphomicrobium sp.]